MIHEMTVPAAIESIPRVTEWIDEALRRFQGSLKAQTQIAVAIDEILGNIAHYASPDGRGSAVVRFEFDPDTRVVSISFTDRGIPFDPLEKEDPDTTLKLDKRKTGGLGIFIVKKTMDEVRYEYRNGMNHLYLKKKI